MKFELYQEQNGELTFATDEVTKHLKDCGLISSEAKLLTSFEENSYNQAMTRYYEFMGWGTFMAMEAEEI